MQSASVCIPMCVAASLIAAVATSSCVMVDDGLVENVVVVAGVAWSQ